MRAHWTVLLVVVLSLQAASSTAHARQDWPGEWHPGRPGPAAAESPPSTPTERIEHAAFRLELPHRAQKDGSPWQGSNCGPAVLGMVLDGFGLVGQSTDDLRFRSHTYQGTVGMRTGTALPPIARVAEDFGLQTFGLYADGGRFQTWSLDDIKEQLRLGRPVMTLVRLNLVPSYEDRLPRWNHYILLTGLAADGFYYSDPLQTDALVGSTGTIAADGLERAMRLSNIPLHAVAFGRSEPAPWRVSASE